MAVECVIFDVSKTLLRGNSAVPGAIEAVNRLRGLGVHVLAAANDAPTKTPRAALENAGFVLDGIITSEDIGANKGSPLWIDYAKQRWSLNTNQIIYVGDSKEDMITASNSHVIFFRAEWAGAQQIYGIAAPTPMWVAIVIEQIFRKKHPWWWQYNGKDAMDRRVRSMALTKMSAVTDQVFKNDLISVFKAESSVMIGEMTLRDFVMLHLLSSLYSENIDVQTGWWTIYPGHSGDTNTVMGNSLDTAAKLFRRKFKPELLIRHAEAQRSRDAWHNAEDDLEAARNQLRTIQLNPRESKNLPGKSVLVLDNFLTRGFSTEAARNFLYEGGATDVVIAAIGKYGSSLKIVSMTDTTNWSPYRSDNTAVPRGRITDVVGTTDNAAVVEFDASRNAIAAAKLTY